MGRLSVAELAGLIRDIPDVPQPGIVFKDITPVLEDGPALKEVVDAIAEAWRDAGITKVVGIESRGFIFGAPLAYAMGVGLSLVRKPGKLPRAARSVEYTLEYGTDTLEMHEDTVSADDTVLVVDDVLATGGTAAAVPTLMAESGARIAGYAFVLELSFLDGRAKLPKDARVESLMTV